MGGSESIVCLPIDLSALSASEWRRAPWLRFIPGSQCEMDTDALWSEAPCVRRFVSQQFEHRPAHHYCTRRLKTKGESAEVGGLIEELASIDPG